MNKTLDNRQKQVYYDFYFHYYDRQPLPQPPLGDITYNNENNNNIN
jgi:hypothetical protein